MYSEARKLHLIEEVLKVDNEATLSALEALLKNARETGDVKPNIRNFSGIWTKEEANEIERIIEESCETIDPDDWK
jgi:hypothetical protein